MVTPRQEPHLSHRHTRYSSGTLTSTFMMGCSTTGCPLSKHWRTAPMAAREKERSLESTECAFPTTAQGHKG